MIAGLAVLLVCQLVGELLQTLLRLPVPGPVIGMILLFCGLLLSDERPQRNGPRLWIHRAFLGSTWRSGSQPESQKRTSRSEARGNVRQPPRSLETAAQGLLQHLALMFVPAGTGIIAYVTLLQDEWLAIAVALLGSTVLALIVTGAVLQIAKRMRQGTSRQARPRP